MTFGDLVRITDEADPLYNKVGKVSALKRVGDVRSVRVDIQQLVMIRRWYEVGQVTLEAKQ